MNNGTIGAEERESVESNCSLFYPERSFHFHRHQYEAYQLRVCLHLHLKLFYSKFRLAFRQTIVISEGWKEAVWKLWSGLSYPTPTATILFITLNFDLIHRGWLTDWLICIIIKYRWIFARWMIIQLMMWYEILSPGFFTVSFFLTFIFFIIYHLHFIIVNYLKIFISLWNLSVFFFSFQTVKIIWSHGRKEF